MQRKAKNQKSTPFTLEMAETFFSSIKLDFDGLKEEMDLRFQGVDNILRTILQIVQNYDIERKEIKVNLWEHDRRIQKLEKQVA
jgi:hypothetical protein